MGSEAGWMVQRHRLTYAVCTSWCTCPYFLRRYYPDQVHEFDLSPVPCCRDNRAPPTDGANIRSQPGACLDFTLCRSSPVGRRCFGEHPPRQRAANRRSYTGNADQFLSEAWTITWRTIRFVHAEHSAACSQPSGSDRLFQTNFLCPSRVSRDVHR